MNKFDKEYHDLVLDIMKNGVDKGDRTGTGTRSVFGRMIRFNLNQGFPLITTKSVWFKGIAHELLWFLSGGRNIRPLVEVGVHIWTEWPYKAYLEYLKENPNKESNSRIMVNDPSTSELLPFTMPEFEAEVIRDAWFANTYGDLGPVYGAQWRKWTVGFGEAVDQINDVVKTLKTNPESRRIMVSAWNPSEIDNMKLPPCHYAHQLNVIPLTFDERAVIGDEFLQWDGDWDEWLVCGDNKLRVETILNEKKVPKFRLNLLWNQRSVDTMLGLPFNIASYALLLEMYAQQVNMIPGELVGSLGDTHIYNNHFEGVGVQMLRESFNPPKIKIKKAKDIFSYKFEDFEVVDYVKHPTIKMEISV